ncbi:MAG: hypothetical protein CFE24_07540 [Flavobacterium sp. BFFFF2]|nr:MAG: hypothetical protein CFE24_07540 [Flavobacterium sp. BFFFF2]
MNDVIRTFHVHHGKENIAVQGQQINGQWQWKGDWETDLISMRFQFTSRVQWVRSAYYEWEAARAGWVAHELVPKILQLENGALVQASQQRGLWRLVNEYELEWLFEGDEVQPITLFTELGFPERASLKPADLQGLPTLLFPVVAYELSRTPAAQPFGAVLCFTDHCDFDSADSLEVQLNVLQRFNIKVTKGFFYHDFSKRSENVALAQDDSWVNSWKNHGHEGAYHSLSQSIKPLDEAVSDFTHFKDPYGFKVWIDHGYQPYNWSKKHLSWSAKMAVIAGNQWKYCWHYLDMGMADTAWNQLETAHFSLYAILFKSKGIHLQKWHRAFQFIRLHQTTANEFAAMTAVLTYAKKAIREPIKVGVLQFPARIPGFFTVAKSIIRALFNWKKIPNTAAGQAVCYAVQHHDTVVTMFQTLLWNDWVKPLESKALQQFIDHKGICIAHTYMSVDHPYHRNRLLLHSTTLNPLVKPGLERLQHQISSKHIWNPTVSEALDFWAQLSDVVFHLDENKAVHAADSTLPGRAVLPK